MKYIFVAGAPGSKWSSVVKNIYFSPTIDRTDYRDEWTYYHDASGTMDLMHLGAYFDPGMECSLPEDIESLNRERSESISKRITPNNLLLSKKTHNSTVNHFNQSSSNNNNLKNNNESN